MRLWYSPSPSAECVKYGLTLVQLSSSSYFLFLNIHSISINILGFWGRNDFNIVVWSKYYLNSTIISIPGSCHSFFCSCCVSIPSWCQLALACWLFPLFFWVIHSASFSLGTVLEFHHGKRVPILQHISNSLSFLHTPHLQLQPNSLKMSYLFFSVHSFWIQ